MGEFTNVGRADEVGEGQIKAFEVAGRQIAVARTGGSLHAFSDICTHKGCSLSPGELEGNEHRVRVPRERLRRHLGRGDQRPRHRAHRHVPRTRGRREPVDRGVTCRRRSSWWARASPAAPRPRRSARRGSTAACLIGAEEHPPYERPPLSKEFLRGEQTLERGFLRPVEWYAENEIELRTGVARRAHRSPPGRPSSSRAGSVCRTTWRSSRPARGTGGFPIPGLDLEGVLDLRTASDAERIKEAAAGGGRAVVVGMGFIGAEVAASLRSLGVEVAAVEPFETPLYRIVGPEVGRVVEAFHRDHCGGHAVRRDRRSLRGLTARRGRRHEVGAPPRMRLRGGRRRASQPNVELAEGSGLTVDNGIVVGRDAVHRRRRACGRRATWRGTTTRCSARSGSSTSTTRSRWAPAAARNMLGAGTVFDDPHWFWSDQYDMNLQMGGFAMTWDRMVVRGSVEDRSFSAFLLQEGGCGRR